LSEIDWNDEQAITDAFVEAVYRCDTRVTKRARQRILDHWEHWSKATTVSGFRVRSASHLWILAS
jgi:hypothetical protein